MCAPILPNNRETEIFFTAVVAYYDTCKETATNSDFNELFIKNYELFLSVFKMWLINNNFYPNFISPDIFKLYARIFFTGYERFINSEIFILNYDEKYLKRPYYIEKLKKHISQVDIYK